jgi:hypothetical protein
VPTDDPADVADAAEKGVRHRERPDSPAAGFTVPELARRWRKSPDWIRGMIRSGELRALDLSDPGSQKRFVVPPEALAEFEAGRQAATPTPKPVRRRKRATSSIDFFPD